MSALVDRRLRACVSICREQLGFEEGCGTRDNAFVMSSLINKYRVSRLFTCFVDLRMAFDSIDRQLLFDKLEKVPHRSCVGVYVAFHVQWCVCVYEGWQYLV